MTQLFNGVLVWGALYVIGIVADAEMHGNRWAALLGLGCAGLTYLCYLFQMMDCPRAVAAICFGGSIGLGLLAGLSLLG